MSCPAVGGGGQTISWQREALGTVVPLLRSDWEAVGSVVVPCGIFAVDPELFRPGIPLPGAVGRHPHRHSPL